MIVTYRFASIIKRDCVQLKKRMDSNMASCVIMDGLMGSGKTTLAVEFLEHFQGCEIDYHSQYAVGGDDFTKKLNRCIQKKLPVIIYDEAGDYNKFGTFTEFNKTLNEVFETFRAFKILIILVLPFFDDLPGSIFMKGVPRILYNCRRKIGEPFGWVRTYNYYRMSHMRFTLKNKKIPVPQDIYRKVSPNYTTRFYDLPKSRSRELDKISTTQKKNRLVAADMVVSDLKAKKLNKLVGISSLRN